MAPEASSLRAQVLLETNGIVNMTTRITRIRLATAANVVLGSALLLTGTSVLAQNAVRGKQLYESFLNPVYTFSCSENTQCHGPNPLTNMNKIRNGTNPNTIISAISSVGKMGPLKGYVTSTDAADMAAYIANPAAATAPMISASATSLAFGATQVAASNTAPVPASVTLTNTGAGNLTITAINKSGTNAGDFAPTGTCVGASVTVTPGASCTLSATFTPSATGTRTATLTVSSNASSNPAIALSGTGSAVPVPSIALSRGSVTFSTQTVGTTSAAQAVTLTNNGTGALTITQVATAPNPEFSSNSTCVGTINPGASCTTNVTFSPTAAGTRSGSLTFTSNAAGSPTTVALSGTSVLTASPICTVQSNSVAFPMTTVGVMSSGLSTTITNSGNAPLQITGVTIGGANASDFRLGASNTCAAGSVPVGGSCKLEVAFQPQSAGSKSAIVTIAHNAGGGSTAVAVTGSAATPAAVGTTGGSAGTSSALAPSNVGGVGSVSVEQLIALALTLLLVPTLRRRLARP